MLTAEQLRQYFEGGSKHRAYKETVDLYNCINVHADGIVPETLIKTRRPSESEETFEYRKDIYVPKTKNPIGKVISSLSKIRRSPDWSIKYDKGAFPASIIAEETLEEYCEKKYPGSTSITNWLFSVGLKNYCVDANAVVAIFPINPEAAALNEYYRPMAFIFNSSQVVFYEEGADYAILQSSECSSLTDANVVGKVYYYLTRTEYSKWEQSSTGFTLTQNITHNFNELPAFKFPAQFKKQKENTIIQESRLSLMLPSLDEAAREYSDLQASVVQHMFPLMWYVENKECKGCGGTGKIIENNSPANCKNCGGSGKIKFSPYAHVAISPAKLGEQQVPVPGVGFVQRDVEIMKLQDERVEKHLYQALAAINMQFLDQTPLNISGEAKQVDREELNNFVYSIAEDLVRCLDKIYHWINEWRYSVIIPDKTKRKAMLPKIAVPEQFDLLPADYLMDDISKAKSAKANSLLVATMEQDYAVKKFYNNPEIASLIKAAYDLDPLPGMSVDEKMSLISNKGITQQDFVISSYIVPFIKRALDEDKGFLSKPMKEQQKKISAYADEKIKVVDEAEKMKRQLLLDQQQVLANNGGEPNNQQDPQNN